MKLPKLFQRKPQGEPAYNPLFDALNRMSNDDAMDCAIKMVRANYMVMQDPGFARWLDAGNNRSALAFRLKGPK